jgi:tetratricopeptide (TPR) repeat protein
LLTPQLLFGEVGSSPDVLAHEPFLERARLQREQERDASARLALGAYVVARLVDNLLRLGTDEELLEGFRWQREAVRRHVEALPLDAPETSHLAGVVAAVPPVKQPSSSLWMSLTAYAYFLEHEGRLEEALEIVILAARAQGDETPLKDFAAYALFAGRLNRQLARWDAATRFYCAAEEVGFRIGDPLSGLRGRLGQGAVHRGQGNYPAARTAAESVLREATALGLEDAQALAYADLGVVYNLQGLTLEALEAHYQAFRRSTDTLKRMRTLGDLALGLAQIGAYDGARLAFQIVANSEAKLLVRVNAFLELMDIESTAGNRVAFERCRASAEEHRDRMSPSMLCDYHYKLGIGLSRFGKSTRARDILSTGMDLAEKHRLNAWYFKLEKSIAELSAQADWEAPSTQVSELSEAPEVHAMLEGLREYADTCGV